MEKKEKYSTDKDSSESLDDYSISDKNELPSGSPTPSP